MKLIIERHKKTSSATVIALAFLVATTLYVAGGCGGNEAVGKLKVAATIAPLADFCRNVGGDLVEVEMLVPRGASPHTFEPTPRKMMFVSEADVFVYNGLGLESWIADVVKKAGSEELVEVEAVGGIPVLDLIKAAPESGAEENTSNGGDSEQEGENEATVYDPHVWLDPELATYQVEAIRDGFAEADPGNRDKYTTNADQYIEELSDLDREVKVETDTFKLRKFVSFHPAFTYFARRYGLEQVGVIEDMPGREPSAGEVADLLDTIKEEGVQVIFTEPQFNPRAAEAIAAESGAEVVLKSLDPLGDPDDPQTNTYIKLIKHNVSVMAEAMK